MRNGSGDGYFAVFSPEGAILKGFDHESPMSPWRGASSGVWPGVLDEVPEVFASFLTEPAFAMEDTTFCIWRTQRDATWCCGHINYPEGEDSDCSGNLLWMLDGSPDTYREFALQVYEQEIDLKYVEQVYKHTILSRELVAALNPEADWEAVLSDAAEIGYPVSDASR